MSVDLVFDGPNQTKIQKLLNPKLNEACYFYSGNIALFNFYCQVCKSFVVLFLIKVILVIYLFFLYFFYVLCEYVN